MRETEAASMLLAAQGVEEETVLVKLEQIDPSTGKVHRCDVSDHFKLQLWWL